MRDSTVGRSTTVSTQNLKKKVLVIKVNRSLDFYNLLIRELSEITWVLKRTHLLSGFRCKPYSWA